MTIPHIMLDLETFGVSSNAMFVSIGAAKFDPAKEGVVDSFHVGVDLDQTPASRTGLYGEIDAATVAFWLHPDRAAGRAALNDVTKTDMGSALDGFALWCGVENVDQLRVWGNGSPFDNVILRNAYARLGLDAPWRHWNDRCYRTIKNLAPAIKLERFGTYHSAVDDAISQALHMQKIVAALELVVE